VLARTGGQRRDVVRVRSLVELSALARERARPPSRAPEGAGGRIDPCNVVARPDLSSVRAGHRVAEQPATPKESDWLVHSYPSRSLPESAHRPSRTTAPGAGRRPARPRTCADRRRSVRARARARRVCQRRLGRQPAGGADRRQRTRAAAQHRLGRVSARHPPVQRLGLWHLAADDRARNARRLLPQLCHARAGSPESSCS
jgi:hypothetical protein